MFDMLVEQSSRVSPLTSVSSPQGSHHLNHTTHLSPQASHSSSDSSSPRSQHDDSSTTSSSTPLKLNGEGGEEVSVESSNNNNKNNNSSSNNNTNSSNQSDNFSHIQRLQFAFEKNSKFANYFGANNNNNNNSTNNKNSSTSNNSNNTNMPLPASLNRHHFGHLESKILSRLSLPLGSPSPQSSHIKVKTEGDDEIDQDQFEMETEEEHTSNENHYEHLQSPNHLVQSPTTSPTDSTTNAANIFQCPLCSVSCTSRHQFNEHLVSHSQHHVCPKCTFLTTDEDILRSHLQEEHDVNETEVLTDDEVRVPKVNSQGKVKTHKCKQCDYTAVTKMDFWDHVKSHIRQEKMLTCPKCPFVTEYKHHLEYHLRNHFGSKPFQCTKCSYSCVNKSMLNSHLKSHSNVYQYRCADCSYATKYCHSLKLHLRKYQHNPSMVLNLDGTPNPLPIIDVYGTRRGPKIKKSDPATVDFNQLNNNSNNSSNNNNNNNNHISNNTINSMKTDYKKRSNSNHNNSNSSSGDDGNTSPKYIKREYYEETPPPTTKKTKFSTPASGSDIESDSDQEGTTNNFHRSLLQHHHLQQQQQQQQQQKQQKQLIRHQMPETPITPTSLALQGLLVANGQHTNEQQQQLAAALAVAAGKNPMDMYAAFNQYFLMNPLFHMATQQQQQQPFSDLTKFGAKDKQQQQQQSSLSQILNQSPMMPRSLSVSPPLSNHRQGSVQQKQHTTSSMIERDHQQQQQQQLHQTPLDLRNPKISPNPYETPVHESNNNNNNTEKRKSRKVKPMRYDRKLLLDPLNLSEKMKEEGDDDDHEQEHTKNIDSDVALDFSNNNLHNNANSKKSSSWDRQQVESARPCKVSPPNEPMLCKYCEIAFPDRVLYSMHMSYHSGDKTPFLCKSCGKHTNDKTSFFLHLTTEAH